MAAVVGELLLGPRKEHALSLAVGPGKQVLVGRQGGVIHTVCRETLDVVGECVLKSGAERVRKLACLKHDLTLSASLSKKGSSYLRLWKAGKELDHLKLPVDVLDVAVQELSEDDDDRLAKVYVACSDGTALEVLVETSAKHLAVLRKAAVVYRGLAESAGASPAKATAVELIGDTLCVGTEVGELVFVDIKQKQVLGRLRLPSKNDRVNKKRKVEGAYDPLPDVLEPGQNVFKLVKEQEQKRRERQQQAEIQYLLNASVVVAMRYCKALDSLLVGDSNGQLFSVDYKTYTILQELQDPHRAPVTCIDSDDQTIIVGYLSGKVARFTLSGETWTPRTTRQAVLTEVIGCRLLPDTQQIIVLSTDGSMRLYRSFHEFDNLKEQGLLLNEQPRRVNFTAPVFVDADDHAATVWCLAPAGQDNALHVQMIEEAKKRLTTDQCRALDKVTLDQAPPSFIKVAELPCKSRVRFAAALTRDASLVMVALDKDVTHVFELDLQTPAVTPVKSKWPTCMKFFADSRIEAVWALPHKPQCCLVSTVARESFSKLNAPVTALLTVVDFADGSVSEVYRANHAPIGSVVLPRDAEGAEELAMLLLTETGPALYKLSGRKLRALPVELSQLSRNRLGHWAVSGKYVVFAEPTGALTVYDHHKRRMVLEHTRVAKDVSPVSARLLSDGRVALVGPSRLAVVDCTTAEAVVSPVLTKNVVRDVAVVGADTFVVFTDRDEGALTLYQPRSYGRL